MSFSFSYSGDIEESMDRSGSFSEFIDECENTFTDDYEDVNADETIVESYSVPDNVEEAFTNVVYFIKKANEDDVYVSADGI